MFYYNKTNMNDLTPKSIARRIAAFFGILGIIVLIISVFIQEEDVMVLSLVLFIFCILCIFISNGDFKKKKKKSKVYPTEIV